MRKVRGSIIYHQIDYSNPAVISVDNNDYPYRGHSYHSTEHLHVIAPGLSTVPDYSSLRWIFSLTTLVDVHVSAISTAEQGLSEAPLHLGEVILVTPWWPSQPWFPHLVQLCVDHQ